MKSYTEMAAAVLDRRDRCLAQRRTRRKALTAAFACLCLGAVIGIGVWPKTPPVVPLPEHGTPPVEDSRGTVQTAPPSTDEQSATEAPPLTSLTVNEIPPEEIERSFAEASLFNLPLDAFCRLSRADMLTYLGLTLDLSADFPDFAEADDAVYGYYAFPDGGVWVRQDFRYTDPNGRTITVTVRRGGILFLFNDAYATKAEATDLRGHRILAVHYSTADGVSTHYAELQLGDLSIAVHTEHLSADDLTRVLLALLP